MLGTKTKKANQSKQMANGFMENGSANVTCVVSKGTTIEGKFHSEENVRFDGKIIGEITCLKKLVMGETGVIEGEVEAQDMIIRGTIKGNLVAKGTLVLENTAKVEGRIKASEMDVKEGAIYTGECIIGK